MPKFFTLSRMFYGVAEASGATAIGPEAWNDLLDVLKSQINVPAVVGVLAPTVAAAIGLVFMWWGVRKLKNVLMAAFKNGKLRF